MKINFKSPLFPLFLTVFIDLLGIGIVIPVMAPLLLDFSHHILPEATSIQTRNIILGFLIASFPMAQFFGAPVLGALADRYGRKKILAVSLFGTMVGYILFGLGILWGSIFVIFLSRILDGFTGGNISVAMTVISDISKNAKEKAKNFGLIGMAFGLGIILGPYIGGKLADPNIVSWFDFSTPFWFAALLAFINIIFIKLFLKETLVKKINHEIHPLAGFTDIKKALLSPKLRPIFIVIFLYTFAFNFFTSFFPVYLITKFNFNQGQIGDFFSFIGICVAIVQGLLLRHLATHYSSRRLLAVGLLCLGLTFPLLLIPNEPIYLYLIVPLIAIFNGLIIPNQTTIVSEAGEENVQGGTLGISQSVQSFAMTIPAIISGFAVSFNVSTPVLLASFFCLLAWLFFMIFFRHYKEKAV